MGRKAENPRTSLRRMMNAQGLTAKALSEKTGIPLSTLSGIAAGNFRMSPERVEKVAKVLHCTADELRDVAGSKPSTDFLAKPSTMFRPKPNALGIATSKPITDTEKLWLYFNNLNRRVMALEAELKELKEAQR